MSINLKPLFPVACFLAWFFFTVSCNKPSEPFVDPIDETPVDTIIITPNDPPVIPDTTIIIGLGDTITVPIDTTIASFTFTNNNCTAICSLSFINNSYNATSYLWDFGDPILGQPATSTASNPFHFFKTSGTFQVVLKANKGDKSSTYTQTVTINRPVIPYAIGGAKSEYGSSLVQLSDGGYAITGGKIDSFGYWNTYLLRTDASRNVMWEKDFGGEKRDVGNSILQTPDGGFLISGYTTSTDDGTKDIYLVRTDAQGNLLWEKKIGGAGDQEATEMVPSNDGGFVMAGVYTQDNNTDALLLKVDLNGSLIWQKQFGSVSIEKAYCVQATPDGGYLLGGFNSNHITDGPPGSGVCYLIKTDAEGNLLWENDDIPSLWHTRSIDQTADGGFILAGLNSKYDEQGHIVLAKIDPNGVLEWYKSGNYNSGFPYDEVFRVRQTSDGGYITCGAAHTSPNQVPTTKDILVIKTDAVGNKIWEKNFIDGFGYGIGFDIQETPDGGYILVGVLIVELVQYVREDDDVYLLKLDANGNPE